LQRIKERSKSEQNRLDKEDLSFHQLVYQGYQEIAKNNQDRIKVIDASKSFEQVLTETYQIIKQFITK